MQRYTFEDLCQQLRLVMLPASRQSLSRVIAQRLLVTPTEYNDWYQPPARFGHADFLRQLCWRVTNQ